ncbi:hypothetical protein PVAP13_3NG076932 [Panicum virgatum]|uniref:Uncharacterized protein n=1 Tax=Panicum virgatum TaxID=38727 RepID=A0A8T0UAT6_PANVG|nr:hypothetical protein PVAP13_3NG076932 [Panicum virgatum]
MLRRSYALQTEAYTGRTMRGFCVVPACRANRLHLVRLARWQLSRVGSTQYTIELAVLASSGAAGLLLSPWCSSSSLVPIPRCLPTSITVAAGASLPWLLHRSDRIPLTRRSHRWRCLLHLHPNLGCIDSCSISRQQLTAASMCECSVVDLSERTDREKNGSSRQRQGATRKLPELWSSFRSNRLWWSRALYMLCTMTNPSPAGEAAVAHSHRLPCQRLVAGHEGCDRLDICLGLSS